MRTVSSTHISEKLLTTWVVPTALVIAVYIFDGLKPVVTK